MTIGELVQRFAENRGQYTGKQYDEANTRVDFIDPFFSLLGWDISNSSGWSESYREVVREDTVYIKGKPKAPDYSFRIGGARKFFIEAKRPSVNIRDDDKPAFQLRRYAYTAKLPLSILTDFEEFAVYDTRVKPDKNDGAAVARIFYCRYDEYEQRFSEIANIFSKESILRGGFDRYAEDNRVKKGTAEVDRDFLSLIETWRNVLAKNIALRNKQLTIYELNYAVQKIIDRIIFLRIAEDREIEPYGNLRNAQSNRYNALQKLCADADRKYNSGLFAPQDEFFDHLSIDDKVLQSIIEGLYYPDCPYEFSVLSTEILGSIYEQFLGKTIRLTASHQAKIEEKPSVRKAGGIYYTPQYIVDYIIKNTVGKVIRNKTPDEVAKVRVVDPACGSGGFALSAYRYLLEWHLQHYCADTTQQHMALKNDHIYPRGDSEHALTISEKQRILLNNIYGVDIDSQAIEVTKLSLLLKLMEGESQESVSSLLKHSDLQALPDLSRNIRCGNALIGSNFYREQNMDLFGEADMRRINVFDWQSESGGFGKIMSEGGFDVVIGNPPYISLQKFKGEPLQEAMASAGYQAHHSMGDIYCLFYEQGYNILKPKGTLGFITSNKWTRAGYGEPLRIFLLQKTAISQIVDLAGSKVFKDATVDTHIVIVQKKATKTQKVTGSISRDIVFSSQDFDMQVEKNSFQLASGKNIFLMLSEAEANLKQKIEQAGTPLKEWDVSIYRGIITGYNEAFIINEQKRAEILTDCQDDDERSRTAEIIKPILRGRDIKRYRSEWAGLYLLFIPWHFPLQEQNIQGASSKAETAFKNQYPAIYNHIFQHKKKLSQRNKDETGIRYEWYALQRCANTYYEEFEKEKIIYSEIVQESSFAYDKQCLFCLDTGRIITGSKIKFMLAILNSKLFFHAIKKFYGGGSLGNKGIRMKHTFFDKYPIPQITPENKKIADKLESLVRQIIPAYENLQQAKITQDKKHTETKIKVLNDQINHLVYQLYDLKREEIELVERKG